MINLNIIPRRAIFRTRSILTNILRSFTFSIAFQFLFDIAQSNGYVFQDFVMLAMFGSISEIGSQGWYCVPLRMGMQMEFSKCKKLEQKCK